MGNQEGNGCQTATWTDKLPDGNRKARRTAALEGQNKRDTFTNDVCHTAPDKQETNELPQPNSRIALQCVQDVGGGEP